MEYKVEEKTNLTSDHLKDVVLSMMNAIQWGNVADTAIENGEVNFKLSIKFNRDEKQLYTDWNYEYGDIVIDIKDN